MSHRVRDIYEPLEYCGSAGEPIQHCALLLVTRDGANIRFPVICLPNLNQITDFGSIVKQHCKFAL